MGLGLKRICQSCSAKFYDLDKNPIICPKCGSTFDPEASLKPKRGRRKASVAEAAPEEIEISLDDEAIEELDDEAGLEEIDEEIRDEMEIGDEDAPIGSGKKNKDAVLNIDDDSDDIIESDDASEKE